VARLVIALAAILLFPLLLVVATGLVAYAVAYVLDTAGTGAGDAVVATYTYWLRVATASGALPSVVPRLALIVVAAIGVVLSAGAVRAHWTGREGRAQGSAWWRVVGAPVDAAGIQRALVATLWQLLRGAGPATEPTPDALALRYADVLAEGLGQPGFRELVVAVTDLDSRRDVVGALLKEPYRQEFLSGQRDPRRRADVLDLAGTGRAQAAALLTAALTPPVGAEPSPVQFAVEGPWRGETHRLCDRPGLVHRLLEEVAAAGATQVIVVSACTEYSQPHQLPPTRLDVRHRIGEFIEAAESAALRDALETARLRFDAVFVVRPDHNPLGPFDCAGTYDRASDRRVEVEELVRLGHEDASHQFVEPVVGASGERLAQQAEAPSLWLGSRVEAAVVTPVELPAPHVPERLRLGMADTPIPSDAALPLLGGSDDGPPDPVARRRARVQRVFGDAE
jgi:hypothetical protein